MKTQLNAEELRMMGACQNGLGKFIDAHGEKTVTLLDAYHSNGWDDIWWYISEAHSLFSNEQLQDLRLLGCDYATRSLHFFEERFPEDDRPRKAIEASRLYAYGDIDKEKLDAARAAAWDARDAGDAGDAARDAAWAAVGAAARDAARAATRAAAWAAWAARDARDAGDAWDAGAAERKYQEEELVKLLEKWCL